MVLAKAGTVRVLSVRSDERHLDFPGAALIKEPGIKAAIYSCRGIVMAGKIPEYTADYMEGISKRSVSLKNGNRLLKTTA